MADAPGSPQRYRFVSGRGDQHQLDEINSMADQGYRVIQMVYDELGYSNNKQIVVLMENPTVIDGQFAQEYTRG